VSDQERQEPPAGTPDPDDDVPAVYPASDGDQTSPDVPATSDAGTTRALSALLRLSPFLDLHRKAGDEDRHRKRGTMCFFLDLAVRVVTILLLLAILTAVAWKTLAPLPSPVR